VLQKEQEQHNSKIGAFIGEIKDICERLITARVMSRVEPVLHQLAIKKRIPNTFYPQVYEKAILNPVVPSTPTPILRPTNPEPPSKETTPYVPKTPTPDPLPLPPKMEYAAGSTSGPLYQPTMFNMRRTIGGLHCQQSKPLGLKTDRRRWPTLILAITVDNRDIGTLSVQAPTSNVITSSCV
jgi:hypothetical protein